MEAVQQLQQVEGDAAVTAAAGAGTGLEVLGGVSGTMPLAVAVAVGLPAEVGMAVMQHAGSGGMGMGMGVGPKLDGEVGGGGGGGVEATNADLLRTDRHRLVLHVAELAGQMERNVAAEGHTAALAKVGRELVALGGVGRVREWRASRV